MSLGRELGIDTKGIEGVTECGRELLETVPEGIENVP
jgi:hypothetical protein